MGARHACPLCRSQDVDVFLQRANVPIHQNFLYKSRAAARAASRGRLEMAICASCGFVFNSAFDPAALDYGASYDNVQNLSPTFSAYAETLLRRIVAELPTRDQRVVEIGCGKGWFLKKLVAMHPCAVGYGFDTTYAGPLVELGGRLRFFRRYFDARDARIEPTVVVCRHVIEHVPDVLRLLQGIRASVPDVPEARVYIETPCVRWILRNRAVWDLFYEHCSYFSGEALTKALQTAGFHVRSVTAIFGGQYLWLEAGVQPAQKRPLVAPTPSDLYALARRLGAEEDEVKRKIDSRLSAAASEGVGLWGAGAKGVTLANLIDPEAERLRCVGDINPSKQGGYLPGTGHPIVGYERLEELGVRMVVNMNPNYLEENRRQLQKAGIAASVVDLSYWIA